MRFIRGIIVSMLFCLSYAEMAANAQIKCDSEFLFDQRFRYEQKNNFDFNKSLKDEGGLFYLRTRIGFTTLLKNSEDREIIRILAEGLDARSWGYQLKAPASQQDPFDLFQGYLSMNDILGSGIGLKVGRQAMSYGQNRLISAPTWSNKVRSFDAGVIGYKNEKFKVDLFYGQVVNYYNEKFNRSSDDEQLFGFYGNVDMSDVHASIDGYFLVYKDWRTMTHKTRYTTGFLLSGSAIYDIQYELELPFQFGDEGNVDIWAYALHAGLSRKWDNVYCKPKMYVAYNQASGDHDSADSKNNTFLPLYGTVHAPYGLMDLFRWQNMREIELGTVLSLNKQLKVTPQWNFFWLDDVHDYWYNSSGAKVRSRLPSSDVCSFVGQEVSLRVKYTFNKHLDVETGYAHFFTGNYVRDTGSANDADWFYVQVLLKY